MSDETAYGAAPEDDGDEADRDEEADEEEEDSRPRFARSYPRDPKLDRLLSAFEAGNYALIREGAPKLAEEADDEAVKRAATDLRRRIEPDPTSVYLLGIGVALLVFLYGYWLMHSH